MKCQNGISLIEVLVALFLISLISASLSRLYLSNKEQYMKAQELLEAGFDVQWISDLLADSVRRAGFTPCLGVDQLTVVDTRNKTQVVSGIKSSSMPKQLLQLNRMSELFANVDVTKNSSKIFIPGSLTLKVQRPIIIADCYHAEIHQILNIDKTPQGFVLTLASPLVFSYPSISYLGEWLEEQWFIKSNPEGIASLYYRLHQSEELSPLIHSLELKKQVLHKKQLLELSLGLDGKKIHRIQVMVRGS